MILLDSHVLIWLAAEPAKLSHRASKAIATAVRQGGIAISAITLWELAWLATHNRVEILGTVENYLQEISSRAAIRPITAQIAALATQLPDEYPIDPCDRLIGATALAEGVPLVTKDSKIRSYQQIKTIW